MRVIMSKKYVDDCIFCKINKGEIPSTTIYEDDDFKVMLDINPASRGHAVILPKNHAADLFELADDDAEKLFQDCPQMCKIHDGGASLRRDQRSPEQR